MLIRTLSASRIKSYTGCPARMLAEMSVHTSSAPGDFGTALHATLEWFHKIALEEPSDYTLDVLLDIWLTISNRYLGFESDYYPVGVELLTQYMGQHTTLPNVVSQEVKESFPITTADGTEIQVTYIIDRVDKVGEAYEVIDYKSQYGWVTPDMMRQMIQPFLYACAIRRKYDVHRIPVTYVMLRQEVQDVTIIVTDEDMDRTERYIADIAQRILDDEAPVERLNPECGFCVRKGVCSAWNKAIEAGWSPTLPLPVLAAKHAEAKAAEKAAKTLAEEISGALLARMREEKVYVREAGEYEITVVLPKQGHYDTQSVFRTLGEAALPYMKVGKTVLDKEVNRKRNNIFTDEERSALENAVIITEGTMGVKVEKRSPDEAA